MKINFCIFTILFSLLIFSSCSLKYDQKKDVEEVNPEFIFENTTFKRYENCNLSAVVTASTMERYKKSQAVYADNVNFSTYNSQNQIDNDGSCGLMMADTKTNDFQFFDGVRLFSNSFGASFSADSLKWNGNNQQLTSGRNDYVLIEKDNTTLYGSGFSASGVSQSFLFKNSAEGSVLTENMQDAQNTANNGGENF